MLNASKVYAYSLYCKELGILTIIGGVVCLSFQLFHSAGKPECMQVAPTEIHKVQRGLRWSYWWQGWDLCGPILSSLSSTSDYPTDFSMLHFLNSKLLGILTKTMACKQLWHLKLNAAGTRICRQDPETKLPTCAKLLLVPLKLRGDYQVSTPKADGRVSQNAIIQGCRKNKTVSVMFKTHQQHILQNNAKDCCREDRVGERECGMIQGSSSTSRKASRISRVCEHKK